MHLEKLAFVMHAAVETAAGISFIAHPEGQLPGCGPAAKLILRQYGGLLLASSMVCLVIIAGPDCGTTTTRLMAAALGSYHVWPCYRASTRIRNETRDKLKETSVLGGPLVHLLVHLVCLSLFLYTAIAHT
ncbi:hypothetical protein F5Y12DRAFT_166364 [Xylaria sp. FL1777]|nr:hypothetical protein F5Y12DRAFT_166364 [Xylaria sp. FL1777]